MGGLISALHMGLRSLTNMQSAIQVVNENVSNVNTPGYSRRRILFEPGPVDVRPYGAVGTGADISSIQSVRDAFVEGRILHEYQARGYFDGQQYGISQLETVVAPGEGIGLSDQMTAFFDSFLALAADPSSSSLRQIVMSEGEQLGFKFRSAMNQLDTLDLANRSRVEDSVGFVNELTAQIAAINEQLQPVLSRGQDGGPLYDQRQLLLNQLSEQVGIQVMVDTSNNMVVTTTTGRLLVVGADSYSLSTSQSEDGIQVLYDGDDISGELTGGILTGLLDFQNTTLASARESLNTMAREISTIFNDSHDNGVDLNGDPGEDLFYVAAGSEARTIEFMISDFRKIAASTPGTGIGDGRNAQRLADLRDQKIDGLGGQTFTEFYSQVVFDVGLASRTVESNISLQDKVLRQLEAQRESVSGVSLDEEAVNLIQYQRSYQASAKLIQTLDQLLSETLNIMK